VSAAGKPRYQQVKDLIIDRITSGELRPSDRVPSENELVESTGVSRMTANRALSELTREGYVERRAGSGTYVADLKATSHLLEVRNIASEVEHRGHTHSARLLRLKCVEADRGVAEALHIEDGEDVFQVLLVHYEDGLPIQLEDRYVLPAFAPEFLEQNFETQTPSAYLSDVSPLTEAEHVVRAEQPNESVRSHLDMQSDDACLVVTRRTWGHGRPVTFARLHHPGSRFELTGHYIPPRTSLRPQGNTSS
jgi:GntR family histidine utilization transcriptional repressor